MSSDTNEHDRIQLRRLLLIAALLAVIVALVWMPEGKRYPSVSSKENLEMMKALYAACNTRDPNRLGQVESRLDIARQSGLMTPAEEKAFRQIVGLAKSGRWEKAQEEAMRFAKDQTR